jgi:sodium/hydrogen exchanger-like protein 6/7
MVVGLVLRLTAVASVRDVVSFDYQMFFNLLLPPIILSAGYELHQVSQNKYPFHTSTDAL